jgi:hypothetical protein
MLNDELKKAAPGGQPFLLWRENSEEQVVWVE